MIDDGPKGSTPKGTKFFWDYPSQLSNNFPLCLNLLSSFFLPASIRIGTRVRFPVFLAPRAREGGRDALLRGLRARLSITHHVRELPVGHVRMFLFQPYN